MGRSQKSVITAEGHDRRESGYYSTPEFVANFLARRLKELNPVGAIALDPCVGQGELASPLEAAGIQVDGFDIADLQPVGVRKFSNDDFLRYYCNLKENSLVRDRLPLPYDFYVLNPPYNCHEVDYIRHNKKWLKKAFSEVGVGNMYSMFLYAVIDVAKPGSYIAMITFDSFLNAKSHQGLRKKILSKCKIHNLILCPQSLFRSQGADVRTCIMILEVSRQSGTLVQVADRQQSEEALAKLLANGEFAPQPLERIVLKGKKDLNEFVIGCPDEVWDLFVQPRISDKYPCHTGISTGADKKHLSVAPNGQFQVPFYKNPARRRFFTEPDAYLSRDFMTIAEKVPNFMVRNKAFLFREGITCSSMGVEFGAAHLPKNSAFGVNANIFPPKDDLWWLLAYLNSSLCTFIVRGILLRTNMITSGYVGRIPLPDFSEVAQKRLSLLAEAVTAGRDRRRVPKVIEEIDEVIFSELNFSTETKEKIRMFAATVIKST